MAGQNLQEMNSPGSDRYPQMRLAALLNAFFDDRVAITDEDVTRIADLTQTSENSVRQMIDYYSQFYANSEKETSVCGCLLCYLSGGASGDIGLSA